ncbi:MAG: hypothetical protein J5732_00730 [Bacteroidaceae bacterium]|nr:hypothetical protein [Bacteroidaceae bacterium]
MKDTELKRQRDRDLYKVYVRSLSTGHFASIGEAADHARRQPAPQWYISARTASLLIGRIMTHQSLINLNSNSRQRIWYLYDAYRDYLKAHPGCTLSRELILEQLVEQPAPHFFVSAGRAKHIIIYERRAAIRRMRRQ